MKGMRAMLLVRRVINQLLGEPPQLWLIHSPWSNTASPSAGIGAKVTAPPPTRTEPLPVLEPDPRVGGK